MDTPALHSSVVDAKRHLRSVMRVRRQEAFNLEPSASLLVRDQVLKNVSLPEGSLIASYYNFATEMPMRPLVQALRERSYKILLPIIPGRAIPLKFGIYDSDDGLVPGWKGILEPPVPPEIIEPDILFVPLLAFNRDLYRLGYGGGYYDRTLAHLRSKKTVTAIGIGFECQLVDKLPLELHDTRLDGIATEAGFYN